MNRSTLVAVSLSVILILCCLSCSGSTSPSSLPNTSQITDSVETRGMTFSPRYLWSFFNIYCDPDAGEYEIVPVRDVAEHWNTLRWLETTPCTDCITVLSVQNNPSGTKSFFVQINHPFDNQNLTGFDVRAICMFDGSHLFGTSELTCPEASLGDGELVNADGYTTLYNATTAGSGPNGLQGYIQGSFATATIPASDLSGFRRLITPTTDNPRNIFQAGDAKVQTFEIDMPDGPFVFGYAVDACWEQATTLPVTDPQTDFPANANCPEPWLIEVDEDPIGPGLTQTPGGGVVLTIDVYDHQGEYTHKTPIVECNELFSEPYSAVLIEEFDDFSRWRVVAHKDTVAVPGTYRGLISVEDDENETAPEWLDLIAYQVHDFTVVETVSEGWARTWGDSGEDRVNGVAGDIFGNVYVVGEFEGTVDFDPGTGTFERTSTGFTDVFLTRFDKLGEWQWTRTWGSVLADTGLGVATDNDGYVIIVGYMMGEVDLDPGDGVKSNEHLGQKDAFAMKLDIEGELYWGGGWGGYDNVIATSVDTNAEGWAYVGGSYAGSADLDPSATGYLVDSEGLSDAYIILLYHEAGFNKTPSFIDGREWGGTGLDAVYGIAACDVDYVYSTGYFSDEVDLDPSSGGEYFVTSQGMADCFISCMEGDLNYLWTGIWGASGNDAGLDVTVNSYCQAIVTGYYTGAIDIDPNAESYFLGNQGNTDVFLCKLSYDMSFNWGMGWGGAANDIGNSVTARGGGMFGNVCVGGSFTGTVDFDYTTGVESHTAVGGIDAFVSSIGDDGSYSWTRTWGADGSDSAQGVHHGDYTDVYVGGQFQNTVDFAPDPGSDEHSSASDSIDACLVKYRSSGDW